MKFYEIFYFSLIKNSINEAHKRGYHVFEAIGFNNLKRKIFSEFKTFSRKMPVFPFYYKASSNMNENFLEINNSWDPNLMDGDSFL